MGFPLSDRIHKLNSKEIADRAVSDAIANSIRNAISLRGTASVMLSGGSTPIKAYDQLSRQELNWAKVSLGLVDDRWVDPDSNGSNEKMLRETLGQNAASKAAFLGLKTEHDKPVDGLIDIERRLADIQQPFDLCVMGMGTDGHTASWFPASPDLQTALSLDTEQLAVAIDASFAPGAGEFSDRISLTLQAVMHARQIILYITGAEKLNVLEMAQEKDVYDAPVKALFAAGRRFSIYWAP